MKDRGAFSEIRYLSNCIYIQKLTSFQVDYAFNRLETGIAKMPCVSCD
jgi:hypothetical protein